MKRKELFAVGVVVLSGLAVLTQLAGAQERPAAPQAEQRIQKEVRHELVHRPGRSP